MIKSVVHRSGLLFLGFLLLGLGVACRLINDLPSPQALSSVGSGSTALENGDYDQAIADFSRAIDIDPQSPVAYALRGDAYAARGDYERAIADYDRAIKLDPQDAVAYYNRGWLYFEQGDYNRAIADFDRAIELDPTSADAYNERGLSFDYLGDYEKALADYDQAILLDSNFALAYYNRAVTYAHQLEYDRAIADFDRAIELDPTFAYAYYNRGIPTRIRAITTGRFPITTGQSSSIRRSRKPITTGGVPTRIRVITTGRFPITTGRFPITTGPSSSIRRLLTIITTGEGFILAEATTSAPSPTWRRHWSWASHRRISKKPKRCWMSCADRQTSQVLETCEVLVGWVGGEIIEPGALSPLWLLNIPSTHPAGGGMQCQDQRMRYYSSIEEG